MAAELKQKMEIEQERLRIADDSTKAQIEAKRVTVEQLRAAYKLKQKEVDDLKVEEGQKVTAGTPLAKVVQPWKLKAELHIPETQAKDILINQDAQVDTRNGI